MLEMQKAGAAENEEVELKRWQKSVLNLMKNQDDWWYGGVDNQHL
jgi:hypothetical protein